MSETLNQKVANWARGKKGQQVGAGECWDLADRALRQAGAQTSDTSQRNADYVWGEEVPLKDIQPGDVLQFRDFKVTTKSEKVATFEDGTVQTSWSEDSHVRGPTHTAIVDQVLDNGDLVILEQHVKPLGKKVQLHTIPKQSRIVPLTVTHGRALDRVTKRYRIAKIAAKTAIEVKGELRAYRPRAQ